MTNLIAPYYRHSFEKGKQRVVNKFGKTGHVKVHFGKKPG